MRAPRLYLARQGHDIWIVRPPNSLSGARFRGLWSRWDLPEPSSVGQFARKVPNSIALSGQVTFVICHLLPHELQKLNICADARPPGGMETGRRAPKCGALPRGVNGRQVARPPEGTYLTTLVIVRWASSRQTSRGSRGCDEENLNSLVSLVAHRRRNHEQCRVQFGMFINVRQRHGGDIALRVDNPPLPKCEGRGVKDQLQP